MKVFIPTTDKIKVLEVLSSWKGEDLFVMRFRGGFAVTTQKQEYFGNHPEDFTITQ